MLRVLVFSVMCVFRLRYTQFILCTLCFFIVLL
ncbi:hypothetical protein NGUA10_00009 [Salmonella enterica]|nr:hypothetical protein NGUA10_00009 [Salmonella enterica]